MWFKCYVAHLVCGYKWKFYVFVNAHHSQKILNITTFQKLNLCLTCWNQCNVMMRMMRRKSSLLREWAANGRFDAANTCWHWTLHYCSNVLHNSPPLTMPAHAGALAHAGVGRNTRVRANSPKNRCSVSSWDSQHWVSKNYSYSLSQVPHSGLGNTMTISLGYMDDNHDVVRQLTNVDVSILMLDGSVFHADLHCGILPIFVICPGKPRNLVCIQRQKNCGKNTFGVLLTSTSLKATSKFIITPECTSWCFYTLKEQEFVIVFQIVCTI